MANQRCLTKNIHRRELNWTVPVMVVERGFPRFANNQRLSQKIVMIDAEVGQVLPSISYYSNIYWVKIIIRNLNWHICMQGTKVQGVILDKNIEAVEGYAENVRNILHQQCGCRKTPNQHRLIDNDYTWFLYAQTSIKQIASEPISIRDQKYDFVPLAKIQHHASSNESIGTEFAKVKLFSCLLPFISEQINYL